MTLPEDQEDADLFGCLASSTPPWFVSLHSPLQLDDFPRCFALQAIKLCKTARRSSLISPMAAPSATTRSMRNARRTVRLIRIADPERCVRPPYSSHVAAFADQRFAGSDSDPAIGPPGRPSRPWQLRSRTEAAPVIGLEFSGFLGLKKALLKAYGGTALTEDAVDGRPALAQLRPERRNGLCSFRGTLLLWHDGRFVEVATGSGELLCVSKAAAYTPTKYRLLRLQTRRASRLAGTSEG